MVSNVKNERMGWQRLVWQRPDILNQTKSNTIIGIRNGQSPQDQIFILNDELFIHSCHRDELHVEYISLQVASVINDLIPDISWADQWNFMFQQRCFILDEVKGIIMICYDKYNNVIVDAIIHVWLNNMLLYVNL